MRTAPYLLHVRTCFMDIIEHNVFIISTGTYSEYVALIIHS